MHSFSVFFRKISLSPFSYYHDQVYISTADGCVVVFRRSGCTIYLTLINFTKIEGVHGLILIMLIVGKKCLKINTHSLAVYSPPLYPVYSYWMGSGEPSRCRGDYRQECDDSLQLPCHQQAVAGSGRDLPYSQPADTQITGEKIAPL